MRLAGNLVRAEGRFVSTNFFDVIEAPAAVGSLARFRDIAREGHVPVIVGSGFWKRHLGGDPGLDRLWRLLRRIEPLGWHLDLHFDAIDLPDHDQLLAELPVPFIIDHMARVPAIQGTDQDAFTYLVGLLSDNDLAWVKISGAERITADGAPPYEDVVPFARRLIEAVPDRVLWGTDWPHPNVRHMPDDGDLLDVLADFAPDEATRARILVDNPDRLYDFGAGPTG